MWYKKAIIRDHLLLSLGKPHHAKWYFSREIFLSYPHTHNGFLYIIRIMFFTFLVICWVRFDFVVQRLSQGIPTRLFSLINTVKPRKFELWLFEILANLTPDRMDPENRTYLWTMLRTIYKKTFFECVKETSQGDVSFTYTKHMFKRKRKLIIIFFMGLYTFLSTSL